ncbi:PAS domain S-box-containing protein [Pontibacter aydingkolensis]|uniref:histidine kinase n=1 Tax=Pontibacter aydingkolensis TaxID=1911536 RepID=A0ABS7CSF6_9BACT|nr:PAS domain-containing protein [Pontibacter aydingkolensis]MBW7466748.1 PAS domain-containing protein [Pontibacter aydingkolensis]
MQSSPGNKHFIFSSHRDQAVKLIGIIFTVLAVLLVGVGYISFVGAREIEENYSLHLSKTIQKLELINEIHLNNDKVNHLIERITDTSTLDVKETVSKLKEAHDTNTHLIRKLEIITTRAENKRILRRLIAYRKAYYHHTDSISELALRGRVNGAALYKRMYLTPVNHLHQQYLTKLSNNFQKSIDNRDTQSARLLSGFVKHQEILLLLVLLASGCAIFLTQYLFKRLRRENLDLSNEINKRQELQNELYKSQHIYKTLFDSNPIPMWIYDLKTLRILKSNTAASKEYGYTSEEFLKKKISDLKLENDLEHYLSHIIPNTRQHSVFQNVKHKRKNGSEFRVEVHSHALPEEEGTCPRLVVAVNVEVQFNAIEKIERNEKQLREISSSIPGAVYQFHMAEDKTFRFPFVSAGIKQLYGVSPEEIYDNPSILYEKVHPEDVEKIQQTVSESFERLTPWVLEFRVWQAEQKRYLWIRAHSLPTKREDGSVQWNGTFIDITRQKEAQQELARNEANLKALLDSSKKAVFLLDAELKVLSFNKIAVDYVRQIRRTDLTEGSKISNYINQSLLPDLKEDHALAMQGKEIVFETGSVDNWIEVAYKPAITKDKQVLGVALTINNITEQRNIIETIRKSEAQLAKAQALTKLGSWEYDFNKQLLTASGSFSEIFGLPASNTPLPYSTFESLYHPDDVELVSQHLQKTIDSKAVMAFDHRIVLPGGKIKYLHTIGEIIYDLYGKASKILGATQDISELKYKEQEAREAQEKLQATLENIPEVIFSADADLNMLYISPQVQKITGYKEAEVKGLAANWLKLVHPDDLDQFLASVTASLSSGIKFQYELRMITKDGESKWIELRYSPVTDSNGSVIRIDGSAADITDKKQEEARRTVLTEQLQKQNHHLQQFAYIVSHNLRAPIANILGLTSIYDRRRPEAMLNNRVIDNLVKSAQLLDSTIRDLNDILTIRSQINEGMEVIDFKQTLDHILSSISDIEVTEEAEIDFDFTEVPDIIAVKSYVYSIMLNLITNALKYRSESRKLKLQLKTFRVLDYICLEVQDNGQGINLEKDRDKVFGLYKRFHHHKEGKGIGLHLVKTQAELLGGKVEVDSQPDLGSIFKVYLKHQL